jgi:hypothetical protein
MPSSVLGLGDLKVLTAIGRQPDKHLITAQCDTTAKLSEEDCSGDGAEGSLHLLRRSWGGFPGNRGRLGREERASSVPWTLWDRTLGPYARVEAADCVTTLFYPQGNQKSSFFGCTGASLFL